MFVAFCHSTVKLQEQSGSIFSVSSGQAVVDSNTIPPEPSLLWAEEAQLLQPLLLRPVLQPFSSLVASDGFAPVCDSDQNSTFISLYIFFF